MKKDPIIISGLGGSGTRVIVTILNEIKFDFGYDVNKAFDDLSFTLLFKLPKNFRSKFKKRSKYVKRRIKIHYKLLNNIKLNFNDYLIILKSGLLHLFHFRRYDYKWIYKRLKNIIYNRRKSLVLWGWKEPHAITFIEDLYFEYPKSKFILLIRNGLDMVYTKNDQQFHNYANYFGLDKRDTSEVNKFEFWYRFNKYAIGTGQNLFKDNFHITYYEDLAENNRDSISEIINFTTSKYNDDNIDSIIKKINNPGSIGRYKENNMDWIDDKVLAKLKEIGYNILLNE